MSVLERALRRRRGTLVAIWTAPTIGFLLLVHLVLSCNRIETPPRLSVEARDAIAARLRAALSGGEPTPLEHRELSRGLADDGPVIAQVWINGSMRGRVDAYAPSIAEAVERAAELIGEHPSLAGLSADEVELARIKVDVVVGRGALDDRFPMLDLVSLHPGVDGLGATLDGRHHLLLPDELIMLGALAKKKPFAMIPDFALGLDKKKASQVLAKRAKAKVEHIDQDATLFRFRTDSFVEAPAPGPEGGARGSTLPLERGVPPGPEPTAANLRAAALEGARYLVAHMQPDGNDRGRYQYEVDLSSGNLKSGYSIPRHSGTTYFLAEIYRITKEPFLRKPIEDAFHHMKVLIDAGGCSGTLPDGEAFACVVDKGKKKADLGSSALAVVALAEYQRATGERTYEPMARQLSAWILMLQKPDGNFMHYYDIPNAKPINQMTLYFTGEAALAMARMHEITGEERYARSAERALHWLVDWYDFFAGGFMYGEEHWTCIASEAAFKAGITHPKFLTFCDGYARFLRAQQAEPGDFPSQQDLVGAYNVTPFVMPNNTPAGSRTEAMISTYQLGLHHGKPDAPTLGQIMAALRFTLRQQIRPESDFAVAAKARGMGGVPGSPVDRSVRIDYVQHVCSAMIRASELVE